MYKLNEIRAIHLEVTSKCQASCPMCARNLQGGILNPFLKLNEVDLGTFVNWIPRDIVRQLDRLYMCGNFGDPIIAKDTLEIFKYLRETNESINLSMNTNGSARDPKWFKDLAKLNVRVRFGIDGLQDTHSKYRIGTDWNKIIENARAFINAGGYAIWDMLIFSHNAHQVDACRDLAGTIGFKEFYSKNTSRFRDDELPVLDKNGKQVDVLYPTEKSTEQKDKIKQVKASEEVCTIKCKVKEERAIYIGANGNLLPCCWLDHDYIQPTSTSRIDFLNHFANYPNLHRNTMQEVFDSNFFNKIEQGWKTNPLKECKKQCGTYDRFKEQFN